MSAAARRPVASRALAALALAALALLPAGRARAHSQSFSYVDATWRGRRVDLELSVHRDDAALLLGLAAPESLMRPAFLARHAAALEARLAPRLGVLADGRALALSPAGVEARPARRAVALAFRADAGRAPGRLEIEALILPENRQHQTFLAVIADGRVVRQEVLDVGRTSATVYAAGAAGALAVLVTFVRAGIHHIWIGPDHILFIVGLLLLGGGLIRVLKVATAFTLAHSLTLAVAALGLVNVPARVVEPLIALSIVYVAFENLRARPGGRDWRTRIAFGFGLVHGFGFASVLRETGLPREALAVSLVAFNLGVEIGQACIVLAVTPLLGALRSGMPRTAARVVAAGSWGIALAGGYWFVQRLVAAG